MLFVSNSFVMDNQLNWLSSSLNNSFWLISLFFNLILLISAKSKYADFSFNYVEKYGWPKIIHQFTLKILFLIKNLLKVTLFSVKIL
ncbi:hypothetical protein [Spiroplasma endosymbiont of Amphimallon solstitiale]|uniref:hypothetical protein n=1 Tax=Spiroplasma endosymbiont of Amphimallon solstitiale TaxID=3066288 RepID=UPI00313DA3E8